MRRSFTLSLRSLGNFALTAALVVSFLSITPAMAEGNTPEYIAEGKELAFNRKKGNCLACHAIDDGTLAGNGGPPLIDMQARFPDIARLRAQIWDSTERNPNTIMPPFGRHRILTEEEIDKIAAYVHTL